MLINKVIIMTNRKRNLKKENQAELNERKQQVLWAVVQDYAETAEPVGSRTIARKYNLGVSSATIRNEMQDLEDAGYLEQPHTSAGRIPSVKGYRFYVDRLMEPAPVSGEEQNLITKMMGAHRARLDDIFRDMAKIVASLTHTLSLAASSTARQVRFNYIRFLPLDGRRVILLAVSDRGDVTNVVVPMPADTTMDELQLIADKLNHFLHGRNFFPEGCGKGFVRIQSDFRRTEPDASAASEGIHRWCSGAYGAAGIPECGTYAGYPESAGTAGYTAGNAFRNNGKANRRTYRYRKCFQGII